MGAHELDEVGDDPGAQGIVAAGTAGLWHLEFRSSHSHPGEASIPHRRPYRVTRMLSQAAELQGGVCIPVKRV
jgi:hypothetical protein